MRRTLSLIAMSLCLTDSAQAGNELAVEWLDLWSRCRVAIEMGKPVGAKGLNDMGFVVNAVPPLAVNGLPHPLRYGYDQFEQKWGVPGSRFIVLEKEVPIKNGKVGRGCHVVLTDETVPLAPEERRILVDTFLAERQRLIDADEHEVRNPDRVFSTNLGVGPRSNNPFGCRVISFLIIDAREQLEHFFYSGSSEQGGQCGGPSVLGRAK